MVLLYFTDLKIKREETLAQGRGVKIVKSFVRKHALLSLLCAYMNLFSK